MGKEIHVVAMTAWTKGNLRISERAIQLVCHAAEQAYTREEEACGYLCGPADDALLCDEAVEMENLANKYHQVDPQGHPRTGREYFKINSIKFEKAIVQGVETNRPLKVFFHSHLDCGAYFSEEDAASMTAGGTGDPAYQLAYLVTAVDQGQVTAHKLFVWDSAGQEFVESPFQTVS